MTGIEIGKKIDSFSNLIQELGNSTFNSRDIWNRKKEIDENLKATQFENELQKTELIDNYNKLVTTLQQKDIEVEQSNASFTGDAENKVKSFCDATNLALASNDLSKDNIKALKIAANEIYEYFKQHRWLTKERRTTAWDNYSNARNLLKAKEDEVMEKERDERSKIASQSLEITEKICVVVNTCHPSETAENLRNYVTKLNDFLNNSDHTFLNIKWFLVEKPDEIRLALKSRSETINDVRNFVATNKDNILREHKSQIFANIDALKQDLNQAWEQHKIEQQQKQQEWEIKQQEWAEKRKEWTKKQQDFLQMLEKRLENQLSYKNKQEDYLKNQQQFAERFKQRLVAQQDYLKKIHEQIKDLEQKLETAWTDSFKTKVEEWIAEKNEKVKALDADIIVLQQKLVDINKNIETLPIKLQELTNSINEIQDKIVEVKTKLSADASSINETTDDSNSSN
ncbi:MAG: hypothetical protein ACOVMM_05140 [Chitinophagaceae bacterium]